MCFKSEEKLGYAYFSKVRFRVLTDLSISAIITYSNTGISRNIIETPIWRRIQRLDILVQRSSEEGGALLSSAEVAYVLKKTLNRNRTGGYDGVFFLNILKFVN